MYDKCTLVSCDLTLSPSRMVAHSFFSCLLLMDCAMLTPLGAEEYNKLIITTVWCKHLQDEHSCITAQKVIMSSTKHSAIQSSMTHWCQYVLYNNTVEVSLSSMHKSCQLYTNTYLRISPVLMAILATPPLHTSSCSASYKYINTYTHVHTLI